MSQFQKSVTFEIGFAFAPVSSKPCANAAVYGSSFKMRPHFERASTVWNSAEDIRSSDAEVETAISPGDTADDAEAHGLRERIELDGYIDFHDRNVEAQIHGELGRYIVPESGAVLAVGGIHEHGAGRFGVGAGGPVMPIDVEPLPPMEIVE